MTRIRLGAAYWRQWWANAVDSVGDGAFAAALPLLAVTVTRDPRLIAVVSMATYLPWLAVSLPAGALVDRHERVTLMWWADLAQGAVVTAIAVLIAVHRMDIWVLAAAGFCLGCAQVVFDNAAQSLLPSLVPPDLLAKANGTQYVVQVIGGQFAGPPVGSALFAVAPVAPFVVDAVSFAGSVALLRGLPRTRPRGDQEPQAGRKPREDEGGGGAAGSARELSAGIRWLAGHRLMRLTAVLLAVSNFSNQMGMATLVLFVTQTLHVSVRGYGLLLAGSAVGSVLGGLVNPALTRRFGQVPLLIMSLAGSAVIITGMGLAPDAIVLGVLLACRGLTSTLWNVVSVSMRQREIPDALLGRVNSIYRMLGWGTIPLGALAGGFLADAAGLRAPYIVAGIVRGAALLAVLPALVAASRSRAPA